MPTRTERLHALGLPLPSFTPALLEHDECYRTQQGFLFRCVIEDTKKTYEVVADDYATIGWLHQRAKEVWGPYASVMGNPYELKDERWTFFDGNPESVHFGHEVVSAESEVEVLLRGLETDVATFHPIPDPPVESGTITCTRVENGWQVTTSSG